MSRTRIVMEIFVAVDGISIGDKFVEYLNIMHFQDTLLSWNVIRGEEGDTFVFKVDDFESYNCIQVASLIFGGIVKCRVCNA